MNLLTGSREGADVAGGTWSVGLGLWDLDGGTWMVGLGWWDLDGGT
jgi:hypothetical protein